MTAALSKKCDAIAAVSTIVSGSESYYTLVPFSEYQRRHRLRSENYSGYSVLCFVNTVTSAGWLVCNYLRSGTCPIYTAVKLFAPEKGGTGGLKRHSLSHTISEQQTPSLAPRKVTKGEKRRVADSAALAVVKGEYSFNFAENRGLLDFVTAVFEAGQGFPLGMKVDIAHMLPCSKTVRDSVTALAMEKRNEFRKTELKSMFHFGGGMTCDGLKQKITGTKFYDLVVHYFSVGEPHLLTGVREVEMVSRVLILQQHDGAESAAAIEHTIDTALHDKFGISFEKFKPSFTLVTDCASTLPCIVGASSSSSRVPLGEKWMGCISHQLNTAMKHVMNEDDRNGGVVSRNLNMLKTIVRIFKHGNWNADLPEGMALIQEVETRFGTTYEVVVRFLKASEEVVNIIREKESATASETLDDLLSVAGRDGKLTFPALESVVGAFAPIREMQTAMEASNSPTLPTVLARFEHCRKVLSRVMRTADESEAILRSFCELTLRHIASIEIHDLWVIGALLHPRLRSLGFISDTGRREVLRAKACRLLRKLMADTPAHSLSAPTAEEEENERNERALKRQKHLLCGASDSFNIEEVLDIPTPEIRTIESDELSKYFSFNFSEHSLRGLMIDAMALPRFWVSSNQQKLFPELSHVAIRVLAIPVSSAASERNFSCVNRLVSTDRTRLSSSIIEDLVFTKSFFSIEK